VIGCLKEESLWKIDRVKYAGSIGKHTEVMCADFDVVLFLNDKDADFGEVLNEWQSILEDNKDITILNTQFSKSDICLQFSLVSETGNVAVDLLPANNFVNKKEVPQSGSRQSRKKQYIAL